ncbi:GPP34 family phosphoprotein [Herbiconiux sp. CPCC 203407]|uniref:GPP34 family phosphoprotein n=1 Tax=Herbiconiux oxytropis TaxID=2970915 RepID=A0AA41XF48_9MICO|nr:GPP34 family phosphoprotein [Herbiconiux oxytropis]MCS5721471.1 GPP34 family phosphoprotein [Herbiconiux oxytropis]MCS5724548.1 GPP34 family phosphoprotein [Herbiconiux oxytropis]
MTSGNAAQSAGTISGSDRLIAEDVLLALFQPSSGTIAGENTLFYVLGGAVLTDLAQQGRVDIRDAGLRGTMISAAGKRPDDELLRPAWDSVAEKPRGVQSVLASSGPTLRGPLLDRLVARGDLDRTKKKVLGFIPATDLSEGRSGRRAGLIDDMRAVLVDGEAPSERLGAITALVSASGGLPVLHPEIPWSGDTATRAKALERGDWAADAAAAAVTRTMTAVVTNALVAAVVVSNR